MLEKLESMKEQVKGIVYDFKDKGWTVQKIEHELKFANGTLGKVVNGKAGMSDFKFSKLLELHQKEVKKKPAVTEGLKEQIEENNLPENKAQIEAEREGRELTESELEQLAINAQIAKLEDKLKLPSKYLPKWERIKFESELQQLKNNTTPIHSNKTIQL